MSGDMLTNTYLAIASERPTTFADPAAWQHSCEYHCQGGCRCNPIIGYPLLL